MAALTLVMILFFVMALVAAYTNRNLIFEQRIAANSYRGARALAAADAGVEWTVSMLNGGRIDSACQPSTNTANSDFRRRYLADDDVTAGPGGYDLAWGANNDNRLIPGCISRDASLSCICPSATTRNPSMVTSADGIGSTFAVSFRFPAATLPRRPGMIFFGVRGCSDPGSGDTACYSSARQVQVDSISSALSTVGLVRALPVPPIAALTTGGAVTGSTLRISNPDPMTGLAVHSGAAVPEPSADVVYQGPAGSGTASYLANDSSLVMVATAEDLAAAGNDPAEAARLCWFRKMFGMYPATFQRQPAAVRVDCAAGCTLDDITQVVAGHPRNPIWVNGNLDLDDAADLGSAAEPLMLVVNGTLTVSAAVRIVGFVHANGVSWAAGAATASLLGAMVARDSFDAAALVLLTYDRAILDTISLRYGSFVRVPGSWSPIPDLTKFF